jgi:hypothetical protein
MIETKFVRYPDRQYRTNFVRSALARFLNRTRAFTVQRDNPPPNILSRSVASTVDSYLSPDDCRAKALDCRLHADALDDLQQKATMLRYAEWWERLAEYVAAKRREQWNS